MAAGVPYAAPVASAEIPSVFGGAIGCADQGDADHHVRFCGGGDTTVPTWDGETPIDVNVALPPAPAAGEEGGPYPLLMVFHGWGGTEWSYAAMKPWAEVGYFKRGRIGVLKQSFTAGLFGTGVALSNFAIPLTDPDADVITWYGLLNAGEPYDQSPVAHDIVDEVTTHHSSYYVDDSVAPAPLLISNGWTDDLFPPDEAIRFYNRTRTAHPDADISLFFSDHGHQRGQKAKAQKRKRCGKKKRR